MVDTLTSDRSNIAFRRSRSAKRKKSALPSLRVGPAPARHALAEFDTLARGNAEQVRHPPHQVTFEIGDAAIGIDDLPHHLDAAAAPPPADRAISHPVPLLTTT